MEHFFRRVSAMALALIGLSSAGQAQILQFPPTPVGQTSEQCISECYCTPPCTDFPPRCDYSGTVNSIVISPSTPFTIQGIAVKPTTVLDNSCSGGLPVQLPAFIGVGQQLYYKIIFSPTVNGSYSGSLTEKSMNAGGVSGTSVFILCGATLGEPVTMEVCRQLKIEKPKQFEKFNIDSRELTATRVGFQAKGPSGPIMWHLEIAYSARNGIGNYRKPINFETISGSSSDQLLEGAGGLLSVNASAIINGNSVTAPSVTATIAGTQIPDDEITKQLLSLYRSGATPRLLTGIAFTESTYMQFSEKTLYDRLDLWPQESFDGKYIGLMMVPTESGLQNVWNWKANTIAGAGIFRQKLQLATSRMRQLAKGKKGLRTLSALELENWAIFLYRGAAGSGSLKKQYYIPARRAGKWIWIKNPEANQTGVLYVATVRSNIQ